MGLRIRRADGAPAVDEYFARVPSSVTTDRELSDGAARLYAAIRLWMAEHGNPSICLATMRDLGATVGVTDREARRRVAELEARGHVARERIRTIPGAPQGIRPLAQLRGQNASNRTKQSDCNRTKQSGHTDQTDRPPGPANPGNRTVWSGHKKKREKEEKTESENGSSPAVVRLVTARPSPPDGTTNHAEETATTGPTIGEALDELRKRPGLERLGAKKSPEGPSSKTTPRGESRDRVPDATDCNGESG